MPSDFGPLRAGSSVRRSLEITLDDRSWQAVLDLVAAARTHKSAALSVATDAALDLSRSRQLGVRGSLNAGIWCLTTGIAGGEPLDDDLLDGVTDRIFPEFERTLKPPREVLFEVLAQAAGQVDDPRHTAHLKHPEMILVGAVVLAALTTISAAPFDDLARVRTFYLSWLTKPVEMTKPELWRLVYDAQS